MHFIVGNKAIVTPIETILYQLQRELTNGKLKDIGQQKGQNIPVTCPCHKDGYERRPSCMIFADMEDKETEYGFAHCFTCGYARPLDKFIADCFEEYEEEDFGKQWLLARCDTAFVTSVDYLPPIELKKKSAIVLPAIDESVLKDFEYYHDYMWKRKLSRDIVDLFEVGYDIQKQMITFPVRDENGRLVMITKRSVNTKFFQIPDEVKKPVYLLYYTKQRGIKNVAVCESQINALYLWSIGIPAVALFGTGTPYQYELLKSCGIRVFNLYFDGDEGGRKGSARFFRNFNDEYLINDFLLPQGKDVNDLSEEEIRNLSCR